MTPYYEHAGIVIYHGDCREILPEVAYGGDVLVTDPPYGISFRSGRDGFLGDCVVVGDHDLELRDFALRFYPNGPAICFGSWKVSRPSDLKAILIWDKGPHVGMGDLAFPWCPNFEEIYVRGDGFIGHRGTSVLRYNAISPNFVQRDHPTEKPIELMQELVGKCPDGLILDPFMKGITSLAAKNLGRKAIGIEIEEKYCEIAARRLSQEVFDFGEVTA